MLDPQILLLLDFEDAPITGEYLDSYLWVNLSYSVSEDDKDVLDE